MWPVTSQFVNELKKPSHTIFARVDFLDTDFQIVHRVTQVGNPEFRCGCGTPHPDDVLIDGTVDVDASRGTRRTLTMSLLNPDGFFTPDASSFAEDSDWDGFFYINRLVRLWRGVVYDDGTQELMPVGTFMVDKAETLVERGMSTVVIAGSDLWKKFTKSQFGVPTTFTDGTAINTVITTMATSAGITQLNLDPLTERTSASKNIQKDFNFEGDETRGDALLKICSDYGIEVFMNPMGVLTTRDFQNPFDRPTVWYYDESDTLAFFLRTVIDDDRLYNHVIVVGTGDAQEGGVIYRAELKDTDPASPTNITRIGDRVFRFESPLLSNQESVDRSAFTIFYKHFLLSQTVAMEAVCNPALEGNDVVWVGETEFSRVDTRFLLGTFSIPLVTSKQKMSMKRVINIAPEAV